MIFRTNDPRTEQDFGESQTCSYCGGGATPLGRSCPACNDKGWLTAREALTLHQALLAPKKDED